MNDITKVDNQVDRIRAGAITINEKIGGMMIETVDHLFKVADALSRSGVAVPPHCRGEPGTVFALLVQAQEWGLPFMAVINKSYVTKGKGGVERVAYEAQLVHTLIETRAGLTGKLRDEFVGEGDDMICRVSGTFKGETQPHVWESEKIGKIRADIGFNDAGFFKGSPLWLTKPKVQLHYSTARDWARVHCPWVILGVYTPEEIEDAQPIDITPKISGLADRLRAAKATHAEGTARGFDADHVHREAEAHSSNSIIEGDAHREATTEAETTDGEKEIPTTGGDEAGIQNGQRGAEGGSGNDPDNAGSDGRTDLATDAGHGPAADEGEAGQAEIFPPDRKPKGKKR